MAGWEITTVRESLSSSVFIMIICLRSWLDAHDLQINTISENVSASQTAVYNSDDEIKMIGLEQERWKEKDMEDGTVRQRNQQFEKMLFEAATHNDGP